ncbi:YjbH domain-containing protein [Epibacterium sp. SM1979]|uniref:YjbH domain-containing protein n=1 Tax=Tritonibacter litoralis TaxID=2662264 RepID=A0A843YJE3_9RHOB|nr:YjbH domain-containing protein [Tritonibacter litoralis]
MSAGVLTVIALAIPYSPAQAQTVEAAPNFDRPAQPSLNFYGSPGIIDLPSAEHLPEGQFTTTYSWFGGTSRYNLTFQALPWLSTSFRYNGIQNLNLFGFDTYYDRGFDVRVRLWQEGQYRPAVTVGLQDFAGTGIYAGEYIAATKNFDVPGLGGSTGNLKVTAGLGWGRLGSNGAIGSIGTRGSFDGGDTGGELSVDQWFRGDFAPFAGLEWELDDRWGVKAEYSTDAYELETQQSDVFERKSSLNFGVEYQKSPQLRLGAYYLYGSEIGVNAQIQLNPRHPPQQLRIPAPLPVVPRSQWATEPEHWTTDWTASESKRTQIRDLLAEALKADGLVLEAVTLKGNVAEVRYRNNRYRSFTLTIGRVARAMARTLPPSVETFQIVPVRRGLGLSTTVIRRSDLEALEFAPDATDALVAVTGFQNAGPLPETADFSDELYPAFATSVSPYTAPAYFDPDQPFRLDLGVDFSASYAPAPGWRVAGTIRQRVWGNVADGRASNSVLPRVRTDQVEYAQFDTTLENLYVSRNWKPGSDLYARATFGLLESNFGGISGEVLWKPVNSRLALGVEANYVKQRDFDQRFSFRDYSVATGHASAYYEAGNGFLAQVDVGRYLAGDIGATFSLDKTFNNGWSFGGFFTLTDVSAEDFGEGSFDKGIRFRIPLDWLLAKPSRNAFGLTIRPTQRDGGQRLSVPGRLYGQIREGHRKSLLDQKARIWE